MNGDVLPPDLLAHILCAEKISAYFCSSIAAAKTGSLAKSFRDVPNFEVEGEKENQ